MLGKRVSGNQLFQNFLAEGPRPWDSRLRRSRATGCAGRRSEDFNQSCRETMPVPPQIDFTPYAYGFRAKEPSVDPTRQVNMSVFWGAEVFIVNWRADLRK